MKNSMNIMVVDDEMIIRESFFHWFEKSGHQVQTAASGQEALKKLDQLPFDLLLVDIKMPGMSGIELLEKVKVAYPDTIVIIITAYGSIESAVQAMKLGAADYLLKPFKPDQLSLMMEKVFQQRKMASEYNYLKGRLEKIARFENIIGQSSAMLHIFDLIEDIARTDSSVLLVGETGTGKELIAKAIHAKSRRANFPYVAINCGAIPESLLESELFGHCRGAFTGAVHGRKGFLEVVDGGTLFLDEIGEISLKMQVDLLRVLEEKKITPVGSSNCIDVNFRLISATSRNLLEEIGKGNFREDFYYRVNVIQMDIPPLRKRKEDILPLLEHFLNKYSQETTKKVDRVTKEAETILKNYNWPGNVRELENAVERAVVLSRSRTLNAGDFAFLQAAPADHGETASLIDAETRHIRKILDQCDWNITRAAKVLKINRVTLHKKMKRYDINRVA
jgi:two-component system response regulator HydG